MPAYSLFYPILSFTLFSLSDTIVLWSEIQRSQTHRKSGNTSTPLPHPYTTYTKNSQIGRLGIWFYQGLKSQSNEKILLL